MGSPSLAPHSITYPPDEYIGVPDLAGRMHVHADTIYRHLRLKDWTRVPPPTSTRPLRWRWGDVLGWLRHVTALVFSLAELI